LTIATNTAVEEIRSYACSQKRWVSRWHTERKDLLWDSARSQAVLLTSRCRHYIQSLVRPRLCGSYCDGRRSMESTFKWWPSVCALDMTHRQYTSVLEDRRMRTSQATPRKVTFQESDLKQGLRSCIYTMKVSLTSWSLKNESASETIFVLGIGKMPFPRYSGLGA
jgi:hypothetical protein